MDTFKAQSAEIVVDGDVLTLTRKKIGADEVRRIPLGAVTDVRLKPGSRFTPGFLQLVLNNEPPADIGIIEPNTLVFPVGGKHKAALEALHQLLLAAVGRNRAAGGGPVAYDRPKKTGLERVREERADKITAQMAAAGITRPDLVAVGHATAGFMGMTSELPLLARMVRPDEQVLRATHARIGDEIEINLIALTSARLIVVKSGLFSKEVDEFPLSAIVSTSVESEWLSNELELRLRSGHKLELKNVQDMNNFATALRDAVHQASTPAPAPVAPAAAAQPALLDQLAKLGELHAAGILTDEEFQAKKTQLLDRL